MRCSAGWARWGVTHLEDLATATDPVPAGRRRKRYLADGLPDAPGVYQFVDARGEVLYVGTATSIRRRVRSYFTAAENRRRMNEMIGLAVRVVPVVCGTVLEARVRELRLIAEHSPRYNRRSRFPERMPWVRLTAEPFPRLSVVREVRPDAGRVEAHLGPFASRAAAQQAVDALHSAFDLRRCTTRLPRVASPKASPCALAGMGRCAAPCVGGIEPDGYATLVTQVRAAMTSDPSQVVAPHAARIAHLVAAERFEEAAVVRDRLEAYLRGAARAQRSGRAARDAQLVAARPHEGGWELVVVRHGRLAATATTPPRVDPRPIVDALVATAEHVDAPCPPATAAHPEETEIVLAWLEQPGVRLIDVDEGLGMPRARRRGLPGPRCDGLGAPPRRCLGRRAVRRRGAARRRRAVSRRGMMDPAEQRGTPP